MLVRIDQFIKEEEEKEINSHFYINPEKIETVKAFTDGDKYGLEIELASGRTLVLYFKDLNARNFELAQLR